MMEKVMLTKEELDGLAQMPREQLVKLLSMIREAKALFTVQGCVPQSAMDDLVRNVGDQQVRDIVRDLRSGPGEPGGFLSPKEKPLDQALRPEPPKDERPSYMKDERVRGWVKPMSDERSAAQTEIFDEIVGALAGGPNDTSKLR
jgi:hypothetical protein